MRVATLLGRVLIGVLGVVAVLAVVSIPFAFGKANDWGLFVFLGAFFLFAFIAAWLLVGRRWPPRQRWGRPAVLGALYVGFGILLQFYEWRYGWDFIQWTKVPFWPLEVFFAALCAFSPGCGN